MEDLMVPVTQARKRYNREFGLVAVLYLITLFGRVYVLPFAANKALAVVVTLSPVIPILLCGWVIVRFYLCVDEYHRLRLLQTLALTTGIVVAAAAAWSFLEEVGIPRLSNYGVVMLILGAYTVVASIFRVNDGAADGRIGRTARLLAIASILVAAAAARLAIVRQVGLPGETVFLAFLAACIVPIAVSLHLGPSV
jgi:hypothetical protein